VAGGAQRLDLGRATKDILAGSVFVAFGLAFSITATSYQIGTTLQMGPGYFPLVLGGLLAFLGVVIVAKGLLAGEGGAIGAIPWRAILLILGAVMFFGLTVRGLGLVPSLFATVLLSTLAAQRTRLIMAVPIAVGLTVLCVVIFVLGLNLRLPLIGPWIAGS
jgi:putative tricarboxylic transport membrane protein